MRLTWRDGVASLLTATAVAIYWAFLADAGLPLVGGVRGAATAILLIGVGACATGANPSTMRNGLSKPFGFFGTVAFFAGLVAIIWALEWALAIEIGTIVILWAAATLRHALTTTKSTEQTSSRHGLKVG